MSKFNTHDAPVCIPLTKGYVALVSACDAERVQKFKWTAMVSVVSNRTYVRAYRQATRPKKRNIYLSRFVLGLGLDDPRLVDHINHDALDNRRENLRIATFADNIRYSRKTLLPRSSRFIGVSRHAAGKWIAQIGSRAAESNYLGLFATEEEAAMAWNVAARKTYGEFAHLNAVDMG